MTERALYVAADLPWPEDGGGRVVSLRVLESLARHYRVDLIAAADVDGQPKLSRLEEICSNVDVVPVPFTYGRHRARQGVLALASLLTSEAYRLRKFDSRAMHAVVQRRLSQHSYSLLHLDQFGATLYASSSVPNTYMAHNVDSKIYELGATRARSPISRTWAGIEAGKLRRAERNVFGRFDHVFTLSDQDRALVQMTGATQVSILPMPARIVGSTDDRPPQQHSILTLGSMSWFGVEEGLDWFHATVWPRIRGRVPDASWQLVGPNASRKIRAWDSEPGITVRGYLPDIEPVVRESRVCVVPLHIAGGVRIKLIELLGRGRPCVGTSVGAQGLRFSDGEGAFRRDSPEAFADAVVDLLIDDSLWARTAVAGLKYVASNHTIAAFEAALMAGTEEAVRHFQKRNHSSTST